MRDWERGTQFLIFALAKNAKCFVDVGAYSGIYSILACLANPALRSIAFEPNPAALEKLRMNLAINRLTDRVTIVGKALSMRAGSATLSIPRDATAASLNMAGPKDQTIAVTVTTGDDAIGDLPVGIVKIDVEGFEPEVLLGMADVLRTMRPAIIAECLDQSALIRLRSTASDLGYEFTYQIRADRPVLIDDRYVHTEHGGGHNYLLTACPVEELIHPRPVEGGPQWPVD
jgi:FkbM family methyltransferase